MVVGQTGSGKTTLLNFFVNYLLGVEFEDPFRYMLIVEDTNKTQAHSQTDRVNDYKIRPLIPHVSPIILVDTPGFGDTRGLIQDKLIANQIKDFFKNDLDSINAVCFVA